MAVARAASEEIIVKHENGMVGIRDPKNEGVLWTQGKCMHCGASLHGYEPRRRRSCGDRNCAWRPAKVD